MEILTEIQADLLNNEVPLSAILRKARVLASQIESDDLASWVSKELDGYSNFDDLPDYRLLDTSVVGAWTNGYWTVNNRGVQLSSIDDDNLKKMLTKYPVFRGIRSLEKFSEMDKDEHFLVSPDTIAYVNSIVGEDGYGFSHIYYTIGAHDFDQILDTVRNRLLDFILKLGKKWDPKTEPPKQAEINRLLSVVIYNNPLGGNMPYFDQRGQHIQYQFNASGNINIDNIHTISELIGQIELLSKEVNQAKQSNVIPKEIANKAEDFLIEATKEAKSKNPKKSSLINQIKKVKDLLKDVANMAGIVNTLIKLSEVISKIIP